MGKKVFTGDELKTVLTVDGVSYSPICSLLKDRQITKEDINKLMSAYSITRKGHPRVPEILDHISATLQCLAEEPLSSLGRSLQFENNGIDFHAMQVTIFSVHQPSLFKTLKEFFKPISVKEFRKTIGKEQ